MKKEVFIPSEKKFREIISDEVESLLERRIPKIIRRASRKEYLTTAEFEELTGCSSRAQHYYRSKGLIAFSQEGRKIFYRTEDVETFMDERRINPIDKS